jgi:hypothetical protein
MDRTGSSTPEAFGRWKSQRRFHRKITKAIDHLGSSQGSMAESVFDPAAEGEGEVTALRGKFWTPEEDTHLRMFLEAGEPNRNCCRRPKPFRGRRYGPCLHASNIAQTYKAEAEGEGKMTLHLICGFDNPRFGESACARLWVAK